MRETKIVDRTDAITNIIDSVASEQSALSEILSAEAKKLKTALTFCENEEELLELNKSVKSMVNAITRLENILVGKLELFDGCLCIEKEKTNPTL